MPSGNQRLKSVWPAYWAPPGLLLLLAVAMGVALRFYKLTYQILAEDEWHAVHKVIHFGYYSILTDFGISDYSIPLTFFYRLVADTIDLSEWTMRGPVFLCGIAAIPLFPWISREWIGKRSSLLLAWLLALSPLLIYFSRTARPYGITLLLTFVGLIAFFKWWTGADRSWLYVFMVAGVLGPYFNLACLPVLLAPFVWAGGRLILGMERDRGWSDLMRAGAGVVTGLAVLLGPPLVSEFQSVSGKLAKTRVGWATLQGAAELLLGTAHVWLLIVLGAMILLGAVTTARRQGLFFGFLCTVCLLQVSAVTLLQPRVVDAPIAFTRYCLILCPVLLLLIAVGLDRVDGLLARLTPVFPVPVAAALAVAALLYFGPLRDIYYYPNNWTNHGMLQHDYSTETMLDRFPPPALTGFYFELSQFPPGSRLIVEAPCEYNWHFFPYYQKVHRQRMMIGFVADAGPVRHGELPLGEDRVRFLNGVHVLDHGEIARRKVDYVVFHKRITEEMPGAPFHRPPIDVSHWIRHYQRFYGPPIFEDFFITVFDVTQLR